MSIQIISPKLSPVQIYGDANLIYILYDAQILTKA